MAAGQTLRPGLQHLLLLSRAWASWSAGPRSEERTAGTRVDLPGLACHLLQGAFPDASRFTGPFTRSLWGEAAEWTAVSGEAVGSGSAAHGLCEVGQGLPSAPGTLRGGYCLCPRGTRGNKSCDTCHQRRRGRGVWGVRGPVAREAFLTGGPVRREHCRRVWEEHPGLGRQEGRPWGGGDGPAMRGGCTNGQGETGRRQAEGRPGRLFL